MLTNIQLTNFKSHRSTKLGLSNINILTGMNGMGKSSVIQSLLLLRQTEQQGLLEKGLQLNGELCTIGTARDLIHQYAVLKTLDIQFQNDENPTLLQLQFEGGFQYTESTFLPRIMKGENKSTGKDTQYPNGIFNMGFQYLSAYRNGPQASYTKDTVKVEYNRQISAKDGRCELIAHYLDYFGNYIIDPALKNKDCSADDLHSQVEAWLSLISPNIKIHIKTIGDSAFKIEYSFDRGDGQPPTETMQAINTGYGVSYILPIITAILGANARAPRPNEIFKDYAALDKLIIIENPEAHIHPAGQAKLMELIARAAQTGVQFIIETHSDHIINGLLVAVKRNLLSHDRAKVYYFDRDQATHSTITTELPVLEGGRIKKPKDLSGFFDQIGIDMKALLGF